MPTSNAQSHVKRPRKEVAIGSFSAHLVRSDKNQTPAGSLRHQLQETFLTMRLACCFGERIICRISPLEMKWLCYSYSKQSNIILRLNLRIGNKLMLRYFYTGVAHKSYKHIYVKAVIFFFKPELKIQRKIFVYCIQVIHNYRNSPH